MKTLALTLAAAATLMAGAANATEQSFSDANGSVFNPNKQVLFGGVSLDREPTASIGGASAGQVFSGTEIIGGREANVRYTLDGGVKTIISKSYRSSDR